MRSKAKTDVLIVGAGPVGLLAALALARAGVRPTIIDEEERAAIHGYALVLHPATLELLARLGIRDEVVEGGRRIDTVAFYEGGERRAELDLSRLDSPFPFAVAFPQSTLEDCLRNHLEEAGVTVSWRRRLAALSSTGPGAVARVDHLDRVSVGYPVADSSQVVTRTEDVRPDFVFGADGHRSRVRRILGADFPRLGEGRTFLVFEFSSDGATVDEARVILTDGLVTGLWPLPQGRFRFSFEIGEPSSLQGRPEERRLVRRLGQSAYPHVAEERLAELMAERAPWFEAPVGDVHWSLAVRFDRRLTDTMGRDRVWLAGDAAHLMLPVGMHSMNVGLLEAGRLAAATAQRLHGEEGSPTAMEPYPSSHLRSLRALLVPEEGFAVAAGADPWVKEHLPQVVTAAPATGPHLDALLAQLDVERRAPAGGTPR